MGYFPPRAAETGVSCPVCGKNMKIERGCQSVWMHCPACNQKYPIKDFIDKADAAMENFLENVYCDRM